MEFNTKVQLATSQKHLGLILDSKLDFNEHIDNKNNKCNKIIGIMKRPSLILWRKINIQIQIKQQYTNQYNNINITVYKSFVRPNVNYTDIIYNKPFNESFKRKI